jgi:hypothetical protein
MITMGGDAGAIQAFKIELGSGGAHGLARRMLIVVRVTRELRKR